MKRDIILGVEGRGDSEFSFEERRRLFEDFFALQDKLDAEAGGYPFEFDNRWKTEPILEKNPQLVQQYLNYLKNRNSLNYLIDFLRIAQAAPDYAASLLPVFEEIPELLTIYANLPAVLHPKAEDQKADARLGETRLSASLDPQVILRRIDGVRELEKKLRSHVAEENEAKMVARVFDGNVEAWIQRIDARNPMVDGVRVLLRPHMEGQRIAKGFADFLSIERRILRTGLISSASISNGDYAKKGYLLVPVSYEMDERIILPALAQYEPESQQALADALEKDEILLGHITGG